MVCGASQDTGLQGFFMPRNYELCADEAWTHGGVTLNRYWCFYGGIFGLAADLMNLEADLKQVLNRHNYRREVKWGEASPGTLPVYKELADVFFSHLTNRDLRYRQ